MCISTYHFDVKSLQVAIDSVDLSKADRQTCGEYALLFGQSLRESDNAPISFLAVVCGWDFEPDEMQNPYKTPAYMDGLNDFSLKSTTDEQTAAVAEVVTGISDPELKARLSDFVWIKTKQHEYGRIAAKSYFDSAKTLIDAEDVHGETVRLYRAIDLAKMLGKNDTLFSEIVEGITSIVKQDGISDCSLASCLDALLRARVSEKSELLRDVARQRAITLSQTSKNQIWLRRYWEFVVSFSFIAKDKDSERQASIEIAHSFEDEALDSPLHVVKARNYELALHQYRKISGTEKEKSKIHQKLLEAQEKIREEMIAIDTHSEDISEIVNNSRKRVIGKEKLVALSELVFASVLQSKAKIQAEAESLIKQYPLQNLFSSIKFSSTWKTAATSSGVGFNDDIAEETLFAKMCEHYKFNIALAVSGSITPMRQEILLSHSVTLDDLFPFVAYSPSVPSGRGTFFMVGLNHGLQGCFVEALHVLIPQLEHMFRVVLSQNGVITSSIDDAGIQKEFDLNRLLRMKETEKLIGEDLCFVLRCIFTERWGYNLRNEMSHGMLDSSAFFSDVAEYAWWIIMRIVCGPIAESVLEQADPTDESESQT